MQAKPTEGGGHGASKYWVHLILGGSGDLISKVIGKLIWVVRKYTMVTSYYNLFTKSLDPANMLLK